MDDTPILEAVDLARSFASGHQRMQALDGVSFVIRPGVVTGLIGPDGAGKTTLMRLAAGLLVPDTGSIRALGMDSTRESLAVQAALGYMPQRFGLYEDLCVQENLDLYADLQGSGRAAPRAADRCLRVRSGSGWPSPGIDAAGDRWRRQR